MKVNSAIARIPLGFQAGSGLELGGFMKKEFLTRAQRLALRLGSERIFTVMRKKYPHSSVNGVALRRVLSKKLRDGVDIFVLIERQLTWLPLRAASIRNPAGLLLASLAGEFGAPVSRPDRLRNDVAIERIQMDYSMPARMEQQHAKGQLEAAHLMVRALEAMLDAADVGKVLGWQPSNFMAPLPVIGFDERDTSEGPVAVLEFPDGKTERLPIKKHLRVESWVYMADPAGYYRPGRR